MQVIKTRIETGWEFAERLPPGRDFFLMDGGEKTWLPAEVPGHIHLDLMRTGVIGDPFYRMQERGCAWVDETDWTYRTTFMVTSERLAACGKQGKHYLDFHGLDTLCRIYLNGEPIGRAENFFIPHRFDVTSLLREGENQLRVEFDSALRVGRERGQRYLGEGDSDHGEMTYFNFAPRAFIRKPQYMFGWDWGPELASCGIWQPVELVTIPTAEIVSWNYSYRFLEAEAVELTVTIEVERHAPDVPLTCHAYLNGVTVPGSALPEAQGRHTVTLTFPRISARRWQPGSGEVYLPGSEVLQQLSLELLGEDRVVAGRDNARIAFRTLELVREPDPDAKGESFLFRINNKDTFIKGANWIPDHSFPALITRERLEERLRQARDAGFNMLRIWGGGLYESEDFYELCDELGILVWQDFPFACSMYPDDQPEFLEEVRQEAIAAVKRIRNHPSLALWCGGNENLQLFQQRWSGDAQATRFYGDTLIHQTLPSVLAELDPGTPYWPNSPYGGTPDREANGDDYGDAHYWNVWHGEGDWVHYSKNNCRFSSEFGFASPAGLTAFARAMAPEDRTPRSPVSRWLDKTRKGHEIYLAYIALHYPEARTLEDLIYYGQCNQADGLKHGVEHWRRSKGRCWGTLFWQLNDCWPTHSWAVIDSSGEPKAAWYAARRFYAPLLLSLHRVGERVEAHLVNDTQEEIPGTLIVRLLRFDGLELDRRERNPARAPVNAASGALLELALPGDLEGRATFLHAGFHAADGELLAENFLILDEPKNLCLPDPQLVVEVLSGNSLLLTAERFARYIWLRVDGLPRQPEFSDNFFHLAPGQQRRVTIKRLPADLPAAELKARLRIRHL